MKINEQMLTGIREAMAVLHRDGPGAATVKIQETLRGLTPHAAWPKQASVWRPTDDAATTDPAQTLPAGGFLPGLLTRLRQDAPRHRGRFKWPTAAPAVEEPQDAEPSAPGRFLDGSFTNQAGTRSYKLYVPTAYQGQPVPLVVMLHGCTQTPKDFAAGTRLNLIAEDQPCLVLYPAQAAGANPTRCWNWFNAPDQQRGQGEPSLIAGMTREVMAAYQVDPAQVYIAGMSAGGAMAVVMGATYPELYAAVGCHSGLPYSAATDLPSALAAMQGAGADSASTLDPALQGRPIIVFHGDRDQTVHPSNSDRIIAQSMPRQATAQSRTGQTEAGHAYTHTVHAAPDGRVFAEHWLVHGAGHAWSGGSRRGSFTDGRGPDASREMMRFFAAQVPAPAH
jgi:poly(hydroxyalkanoate) depolymerase family esterase